MCKHKETERNLEMKKIEIGKQYVMGQMIAGSFAPSMCNTQYSPKNPCRVVVSSLGRKFAYAHMSGSDKPVRFPVDLLHEVEDAKHLYRLALEKRDEMWKSKGNNVLGAKEINRLVKSL